MKKRQVCLWILLTLFLISGCRGLEKIEEAEPAEFVIIEEDEIPEVMKETIEMEKEEAFQITYEDEKNLYIGQGYGEKDMEGYEITVDVCRESENFIYVHTVLTGPREEPEEKKTSWPYIVLCLEKKGKQVIFLNE